MGWLAGPLADPLDALQSLAAVGGTLALLPLSDATDCILTDLTGWTSTYAGGAAAAGRALGGEHADRLFACVGAAFAAPASASTVGATRRTEFATSFHAVLALRAFLHAGL